MAQTRSRCSFLLEPSHRFRGLVWQARLAAYPPSAGGPAWIMGFNKSLELVPHDKVDKQALSSVSSRSEAQNGSPLYQS